MRAMSEEIMKRLGNIALGALLACSLVPVPAGAAWADEPAAGAGSGNAAGAEAGQLALEPGTYVEHEAIAYVMDGGARTLSSGGGALDGAQELMDIAAGAAAEALGGDADASEAAAFARSLSANGEAEAPAGRLVLVRDEGKTAAELVAELEADPRVVFAEPNAVVETIDADEEAAQAALSDALVGEWMAEADADGEPDAAGESDAADTTGATESATNGATEGADGSVSQGGAGSVGDALKGADGSNGAEGAGANGDDASGSDATEPNDDTPTEVVWGEDDNGPASDLDDFVWGFSNDGRMGGISESDAVDMGYGAWADKAAGSLEEVVVAVIDSGVDASNPDLSPVMWDKGLTTEGLATTGKEDKHGFAAAAGSAAGVTSHTGITSYHGTHVAGTIGAAWDDEGVSGLAPNARIMAVRHNDTLAGMLQCFDYVSRACDAGVDVRVSNNSWGFGQGMWRSVDLAVTEIGQQGVVSVFASGNSAFDNDAAASTATTLADNPYAIVVNAVDPTGERSSFTQYGETTTDVMAPGSGILSTWATGEPNYLGEEDADAVLYESFDAESHAAEGVLPNTEGFYLPSDDSASVSTEGKRFDGDGSLAIKCSADGPVHVALGPVDLSGIDEKPRYVSIRYAGVGENGLGAGLLTQLVLFVKTTNENPDEAYVRLTEKGGFGIGGDSWSGFYAELPENTDWENFSLGVMGGVVSFDMTGGVRTIGGLQAGTMYVDSIGLGSDLVPYAYEQGTSMASPAVAGAATVLAGMGEANVQGDGAKSAEKLAALVKGAAERDERYAGLCSTSGYATVDNALEGDLGPAITAVRDADTTVEIEGYFMSEGATVRLGDVEAVVAGCEDLGDGKARLTVQKPEDFAGGQTVVRVEANGKLASHRADLGECVNAIYYDQTNLPVPEELASWGSWQLVGFNGDIYCLPRTTNFNAEPNAYDYMLRYRPDTQKWEQVPLPTSLAEGAGLQGGIIDVSGATVDGALVLQLADEPGFATFVRYTASGTWELTGCTLSIVSGAPLYGTLASDGESAYVFGGLSIATGAAADNAVVYRVNLDAPSLEACGTLSLGRIRPQVSYGNGAFVVSGGISMNYQAGGVLGVELVTPQSGGMDPATGEPLPAGWLAGAPVDTTALVTETGQMAWASGALADGFALVGPESDDGATDTYLLASGGSSDPEQYDKRASWQKLLAPAATAYRGQLYVLASAQDEPYHVFSATAVETVEQPGDYVAPEPEPTPEPEPGPQPEPEPGPTPGSDLTSDPTSVDDDGSGAALKPLASTGDPLGAAVLVLAGEGALALAAAVTAAVVRRRRAGEERR